MEDLENWPEIESYQNAKKTVKALKVVNDYAERAMTLATASNSSVTKNNEQMQFSCQKSLSREKCA